MTRLRQMMLEELERRNYAETTIAVTSVRWKISQDYSSFSRPLGSPAHPRVPSLFVPEAQAVSEHRYPTVGRSAIPLH